MIHGEKCETGPERERETGSQTPPGTGRRLSQVAERKKAATKKAAEKKPKNEKPAVLGGAVPEYANATAISKLLGKSVRRVQQLTQDGILETEVPPGGGARKYRTSETIQQYLAHIQQKAKETGEQSKAAELTLRKLEAEVKLKESQGQLHRLKTAIAEGEYIPAEQATEELEEFMVSFKRFAMAIPARAVGTLSGNVDALAVRAMERSMRKELETMLAVYFAAGGEETEGGS